MNSSQSRIIKLLEDIDQLHFITGMHSPEIQLGLKLRKDSQEQNDKNEVLRALSEDLVLQVRLCCLNIHLSKAGTAIWQITNYKGFCLFMFWFSFFVQLLYLFKAII